MADPRPPDAMVIPRSHFQTRYRPYSLYFFDPTGSVLVPEQVHLPRGFQAPTMLVSGLLAGPPAWHAGSWSASTCRPGPGWA